MDSKWWLADKMVFCLTHLAFAPGSDLLFRAHVGVPSREVLLNHMARGEADSVCEFSEVRFASGVYLHLSFPGILLGDLQRSSIFLRLFPLGSAFDFLSALKVGTGALFTAFGLTKDVGNPFGGKNVMPASWVL